MNRARAQILILPLAAALLFVATLASASTPALAQEGEMSLRSQTPYVSSNGTFRLIFDWSGPVNDDLFFAGTVFSPISDEQSVFDAPTKPFHALAQRELTRLPRVEGGFEFTLDIRSVADGDTARLLILESGVLPISLEVRTASGETLGALRTNLIRLPTETAEIATLPVAFVIEVAAAEGLTIPETTEILTRHASLPIAVALGDSVVSQLEGDPARADAFREALGGRPVIAPLALNLDPSALASIERGDLYRTVQQQTSNRLAVLGLTVSSDTLALDTNLTRDGVDLLLGLGYNVVLDTSDRNRPSGFVRGSEGSVRLLQVDDDLTAQLGGRTRSVARVHSLLAELAVRWRTDRTPILLGGAELRAVPTEAIDTLLEALEAPGLLTPVSLDVQADDDAGAVFIRPDEQPSQNLDFVRSEIESFSASLITYEQFHVTGDPAPETFATSLLTALTRDLNPEDRQRTLARLQDTLDTALGGVVLPDGQSVTLAANSAPIPLSVENNTNGTRSVLIVFESDKIEVEQNNSVIPLPAGASTVEIDLETRSLGLSPLTVRLFTPDGSTELATTQFGVRSTAIPGLGLLLTAASFVFLIAWWVVSWSRNRARRTDEVPEPTADARPTVDA